MTSNATQGLIEAKARLSNALDRSAMELEHRKDVGALYGDDLEGLRASFLEYWHLARCAALESYANSILRVVDSMDISDEYIDEDILKTLQGAV